uniref:Cation/H+ exchanger domain-containing protein n=1 Tax=Ditylenchus dipsaci TaxID=166011 RepID=A0A915EJR1_9BILA
MLAQCSETVIFMFLGLSTISSNHHFDTLFLVVTVAICLIYRSIGVVVQCAVLNRFRNKNSQMWIMVSMDDKIGAKNMFVTTCIAVIYFTVFLQGITIRPLLHWLEVEKQDLEKQDTMIENVYNRYCDYTMAGIEDIAGMKVEILSETHSSASMLNSKSNKVAAISASMPASNYSTVHSKYEQSADSRKQSLEEATPRDRSLSLRTDLDHRVIGQKDQ